MENNYSVYQHVTPDGMYYFGQTKDIKRRWGYNGIYYKRTSLQPYIEKYGWDNIQHIVLFRDQTRENALWIENFLIETAREDGVCINKQRSGLVSKEEGYDKDRNQKYYEQNKGQIQQRYQKNRDEINERKRQRYQKNREKELEQKRQHYQKNREKINERRRQQYQKNREKINEQRRERYQKNREKIKEQSRERYQRKKQEKQFKELGCLPLW